jgi:signal transduction histidine kinase
MSGPALIPLGRRATPALEGDTLITHWITRTLAFPLAGKLAGANVLIVVAVLAATMALHGSASQDRRMLAIIGLALAGSFAINMILVTLALRPLRMLEDTATRVRQGDLRARVGASPLADRRVRRVGDAINRLLDELVADRARVRRLASEVIQAGDDERARIARDLHDSTAQTLSAVVMQLATAIRDVQQPALAARLETVRGAVVDALEEVRGLSHTVHPRVLDDLGLPAALRNLARDMEWRTEVPIALDVPLMITGSLPRASASVLYRIAQEALANALKHASPSAVKVSLRVDEQGATLEVTDDGRGFEPANVSRDGRGLGIFSMRERVALVDGAFDLTSGPGMGTRVRATVPLDAVDSIRGMAS